MLAAFAGLYILIIGGFIARRLGVIAGARPAEARGLAPARGMRT